MDNPYQTAEENILTTYNEDSDLHTVKNSDSVIDAREERVSALNINS